MDSGKLPVVVSEKYRDDLKNMLIMVLKHLV